MRTLLALGNRHRPDARTSDVVCEVCEGDWATRQDLTAHWALTTGKRQFCKMRNLRRLAVHAFRTAAVSSRASRSNFERRGAVEGLRLVGDDTAAVRTK